MSAYFVPTSTIDRVVASMLPVDDPDQFGRNLFELNRLAMVARYPQIIGIDKESGYIEARDSYKFTFSKCETFDQIKACEDATRELWYQCLEGDLPETDELFAKLEAHKEMMAARLSEAKKAKRVDVSAKVRAYTEANPVQSLSTVETSRFLRAKYLKDAFPGVKFSVRSRRGDIDIEWTNGPTSKMVSEAVNKLRATYDETGLSSEIVTLEGKPISASLRYVSTRRNITESFIAKCTQAMGALSSIDGDQYCKFMNRHAITHRDEPWHAIPACVTNKEALARVQKVTF